MCGLRESIKLLRYLCVWRINGSLVHLPHRFNQELPWVLGHLIAERLPTRLASDWNKYLSCWKNAAPDRHGNQKKGRRRTWKGLDSMPEMMWPLHSVFHCYPGKRTYCRGEPLVWELKLLGNSADHMTFLEILLPAMEEAGYTKDPRWNRHNALWGRFDIDAVYVANGGQWDPLVQDGQVDLRYRPTPAQWAATETEKQPENEQDNARRALSHLHWITPFEFARPPETLFAHAREKHSPIAAETALEAPSADDEIQPVMSMLLAALVARLDVVLNSQHRGSGTLWDRLNDSQTNALRSALLEARQVQLLQHELTPHPNGQSNQLQGKQVFSTIPAVLLPYLDLAAILHVGKYTQFGCGSFVLT